MNVTNRMPWRLLSYEVCQISLNSLRKTPTVILLQRPKTTKLVRHSHSRHFVMTQCVHIILAEQAHKTRCNQQFCKTVFFFWRSCHADVRSRSHKLIYKSVKLSKGSCKIENISCTQFSRKSSHWSVWHGLLHEHSSSHRLAFNFHAVSQKANMWSFTSVLFSHNILTHWAEDPFCSRGGRDNLDRHFWPLTFKVFRNV